MRRIVCGITLLVLLAGPHFARAAVDPAPARDFADSVGVNTHVVNGDSAYGDWSRVLALLRELGVRHVRDGVYGNPDWAWFNDYFQSRVQQAARQGVRFDFIMGQPGWDGGTIDQLVGVLSGPLADAVEAVEDPDEWDTVGGADFAPALAAYDQQVYEGVKASPALQSVPVVGPGS
jgi:hypothetical protein